MDKVALAASGSIALVALTIGTAASDTTGDIIAGVFLASDEDFKVGYTATAAGRDRVHQEHRTAQEPLRGRVRPTHCTAPAGAAFVSQSIN